MLTTLVPGSFKSSPLAIADSYACTGNVGISVPAINGLLVNDFDDNIAGLLCTAETVASANGGSATISANGSFGYTPPPGFIGTDAFDYTLNDGNDVDGAGPIPGIDVGTVTITVSNLIWFIDNSSVAATSDGRRNSPFKSLADFNSGSTAVGNVIYIEHTGANYSSGIVLADTERLFGEGHTGGANLSNVLPFTLAIHSVVLPAINGTRPVVTNAGGDGVTLAADNSLRGFDVGACSDFGMQRSGMNSVGNLIVSDVSINNTSGGGFDASHGSGASMNAVFSSISSTGGTNGINLTSCAGVFTANGGTITNPTGAGVNINGGTTAFTYNGSIIQASNAAIVNISGGHLTGTVMFQTGTLSANNGTGLQFDNADGTYQFNGMTTLNGGDAGIDILNGSTGTFTFGTGTAITRSNSVSGSAFNLLSSDANVTYNGSMTLGTGTGNMVAINNHDAGTMNFNTGSLTKGSSTTQGISIQNSNGGTINFNNPTITITMTSGNAVSLTNNAGGIINFPISGGGNGMNLTTTSGTGFNATGGGTVNVTGTVNNINSTTGTALNVVSTTIGASGLNFQSISANGGANGIVLNTTGSSGGLTVTGMGTTDGTGGTIQNTTGRGANFISATNITLKNMNFTNAGTSDLDADNSGLSTGDNLVTNAAIHIHNVTGTNLLDNLNISGGAEQGINGNNVSNFTLNNSSIVDVGNEADEDGIHFYNMSGTCAITNTTINCTVATPNTTGGDDHLNLQMQSGSLNLSISSGSATNANKGSGYLFGIRGTSNATITFSSANSSNNFSGGIVADVFDSATMNLTVTNSTSSSNNDQLSVSAGDNCTVELTATGNSLSSPNSADFVVVSLLGSAFDNGFNFDASLSGNTITVGSGRTADGIVVFNAGGGSMDVAITNNTIDYAGTQRAILVQTGQDGNGSNNVTITGNNIDIELDGTGNAVAGILAQSAITGPGNTSSLCADIGGAGALSNTFTHSLGGTMAAGDIRVRQRNDGTVRLPGYGGGATDIAPVIAFLNGRNTVVSASTATFDSSGFSGGAACTQP
ncbi:MAG: hypothetical protein IPL46_02595 [Saprospiraceae bacterium]|nr:hypothetical protein [Saprospiraceae bacterium]